MLLLEALNAHGGRARLTTLAEASGLSKSTAHGLLDTLAAMGYVTRDGAHYALGLRLHALARPLDGPHAALRDAFRPALRAFAELCGENCFLAVPGGARSYLTIAAVDGGGQPLRLPDDPRRDAMATSAVGKVLMANDRTLAKRLRQAHRLPDGVDDELRIVRNQGYALDLGASERSLHCVALPLRVRGRVVAALSAGGPSDRLGQPAMQRLASSAMRSLFDLIKL